MAETSEGATEENSITVYKLHWQNIWYKLWYMKNGMILSLADY